MSALPPGWVEATLEDVADNLDSQRIPVNRAERAERVGAVPYYGATGQVGWIDKPIFEEELCLVGEDGAPFLNRNKPKAYVIHGPSWVNNHAHVLRAVAGLTTNRFLKYTLDITPYEPYVNGTTRLKLTKSALNRITVHIPPLNEQRRIVAEIEEQFSRLDMADVSLADARRRLEGLRRSVAEEVTRVPGRRVAVGAVAEVQGGIQKQPKRRPVKNRFPFLRVANVLRGRLDLADVHEIELFDGELERLALLPGDLLVVEGNGSADQIGRSALWKGEIEPCVHQNHLIRVRPGSSLEPHFVDLYWNAPSTAQHIASIASSTSGLYTLSATKVRAVEIKVPSLEDQRRIVAIIEARLSAIDALRVAIERAQRRSVLLRRAVLERAFRGELVAQDPSDEPASALLERIRDEREASPARPRRRRVVT